MTDILPASGRTELFLDDQEIEAVDGLTRTFHTPEPVGGGPIVEAELPWESGGICPMSVIFDPQLGKFRMWYQTYYRSDSGGAGEGTSHDVPLSDVGFRYGVGYAESSDGIRFDKPPQGRVTFGGQDTNLAIRGYFSPSPQSCILRPSEPNPAKRFRLWVWDEAPYPGKHSLIGMSLYYSADGRDWKGCDWNDEWCNDPQPFCYVKMVGQYRYPGNIGPNECNGIMWDPKINKYVNYCRVSNGSVRCIGRMESDDGMHWGLPKIVAAPDLDDPFLFNFYWAKAHRSGEFVILYVMTHAPCQGHGCHVQILASRDGHVFQRIGGRRPWIANGAPGSWNAGMVNAAAPVLYHGKLWIYAGGTPLGHDKDSQGRIGLYHLRPDGYVSLDGGSEEGSLVTRKMVWLYDDLLINADASGGEIRVEVLPGERWPGHQGREFAGFKEHYPSGLPGFERNDCRAVTGDGIDSVVQFAGGSLASLKGKYVQLRFYVRNARLYSWSVR